MANRLCEDLRSDEEIDLVEQLIHRNTEEASKRGFQMSWMKRKLYHIETTTISRDENMATIHLTGVVRMEINPVFAWVASIFSLGDTHDVDHVLELVNESGRWKVCGSVGRLSSI